MDDADHPRLPGGDSGTADDAPRLPEAAPSLPQAEPAWSTAGVPYTPSADANQRLRRIKWVEYEEPGVLDIAYARLAVLASRCLVVIWAVVALAVAVRARSRVIGGEEYRIGDARLELWGVAVAVSVALSGWFLSDRTTQDIHLLQARLPSRLRCVTAWLMPLLWALLLTVTILRLEPTELFDVRPMIIGIVFATAAWRPFALIRRMIRSLIRVDSDLLVGAAFVLEIASLGVLWWRLQTLPHVVTGSERGLVAALIGLAAVAVVASVLNVGCWVYLLRDIERGIQHRRVAMRTRDEHRQLRNFGIDPMDPEVRLAVQRIRQEDEERQAIERAAAAQSAPPGTATEGVAPTPDEAGPVEPEPVEPEPVEPEPVEPEPVEPEPVEPEPVEPEPDEPAVPTRFRPDEAVAVRGQVPSGDTVETDTESGSPEPERSDRANDPTHRSDDNETVEAGATSSAERPPPEHITVDMDHDTPSAEGAAHPDSSTVEPPPERDPVARLAAASQQEDRSANDEQDIITRLTARTAALQTLVDELSTQDEREPSILDRLAEHGITAGGPAIPVESIHTAHEEGLDDGSELIVDRMYSLETARYVLMAGLLATLAAAAWLLMRSTGVEELVEGEIPVVSIERLDAARRLAITALSAGLAVVPLWCAAAGMWSRRAGVEVTGTIRCLLLFGVVLVINVVSAAVDPERSTISLLGVLCGLGAAMWSVPVMIAIQRQFRRSTTVTTFLPISLAFAVTTSWIAGFERPVRPTDSIETMSFLGGLFVLAIAVVVIVAAISTADIVEAIKLSPRSVSQRRAQREPAPDAHQSA